MKKVKCTICGEKKKEIDVTYKKADLGRKNPICYDCLFELFYEDKKLDG